MLNIKIKTNELQGAALDWAVAKCEGLEDFDAENCCFYDDEGMPFEPSCVWAQGGPIIEREGINLVRLESARWEAWPDVGMNDQYCQGPTPLVAAMRCYVGSRLGNEVEIPEELLTWEIDHA